MNEFEVEGNELIMKANEMAEQMIQMAAYTRGKGELQVSFVRGGKVVD